MLFASMFPKIAPSLRTLGRSVIYGYYPKGHNCPLVVQISSLRLIGIGNVRWRQQLPLPFCLPEETKDDLDRVAILKTEVEKARQPRDRSLYDRSARGIERIDSEGNLRCTKCRLFKATDSFSRNWGTKYGYQSWCKLCERNYKLYYRTCTLRGIMNVFLNRARSKSVKRSRVPGRSEAGHCTINLEFLLHLWLKQKGRCAYSDIVMNIEPFTSWRMSLERCDNTLGYVPGNVVFICAEFNTSDNSVNTKYEMNGSSQWSREKVRSVPKIYSSSVAINDIELDKVAESFEVVRKGHKNTLRLVSSSGDISCSSCKLFRPLDDFYVDNHCSFGRAHICKSCKQIQTQKYRDSAAGFMKKRLLLAKYTAQQRTEKGRDSAGEFDLTIKDIVSLYKNQRGVCYYSGIKMALKPRSTWMCSIERLDNKKGYVRSNVALICCEFQTSDASVRAMAPVAGSAQWSKDKFSMLLEWLKSKKHASRAE